MKIEGIQRIIKYAIWGLDEKNIIISDNLGVIYNDFVRINSL